MKRLYVAGKSGGHILPALTLAKAEQQQGDTVLFVALNRPLDRALLQNAPSGSECFYLTLATVYPRKWWCYPWYALQFAAALLRSLVLLRRTQPDEVVSMGGYVSIPVCWAARLLRIPYRLYEFNAEPGAAVALLARHAHEICYTFPELAVVLQHQHMHFCAYPVRYGAADCMPQAQARRVLNIPENSVVIFITGGSQGSRSLNELVKQAYGTLAPELRERLYCIHQTGAAEAETLWQWYVDQGIAADVFAYRDHMAAYYNAADSIVSRAGAGALHEIAYFGKRALIVPLEAATTSHQYANARAFVARNPQLWSMARTTEVDKIIRWIHGLVQEFQSR